MFEVTGLLGPLILSSGRVNASAVIWSEPVAWFRQPCFGDLDKMFIKVPLFQETLLALKNSCLRACVSGIVLGAFSCQSHCVLSEW